MRPYPGKTVAHVYDYADVSVPVLRQMHLRRLKTYTLLGAHGMDTPSDQGTLSFSDVLNHQMHYEAISV